jgi:phthalate 4,5-dioxygenase
MLSHADNERLCRVGAETPMGQALRRYWIPVLLSEELPEKDGSPVRVRLLGENLVAFRQTSGKIGLVDEWCPHRRASLYWGRNEEEGIRCVYHGWKFNSDGQCVDQPNEPETSRFKDKVKITAYPTWEGGGVVWVYMGPRELQPPVPEYEWVRAPKTHSRVSKTFEDANWIQAMEGGLDTSHASFLHNMNLANFKAPRSQSTNPKLIVEKTNYGYRYFSLRNLKDANQYIRGYHFLMPFQQARGETIDFHTGEPSELPSLNGHLWVPVDDTHCAVYNWMLSPNPERPITDEEWNTQETFWGRGPDDVLPDYRLKRNKANEYLIDREVQKHQTFSGIEGINTEDFALQESMEYPFTDRSKEHLGSADAAIITMRQLLLEATYDVEKEKTLRGVQPEYYNCVRPYDAMISKEESWEVIRELMVAKY